MGVEYYYCTGNPADVANEVRTSLAQHIRPSEPVTIGITDDPERRLDALMGDSGGRLVVLHEASSRDHSSQVQSMLVEWLLEHDHPFETREYVDEKRAENDGNGPEYHYVYVLFRTESGKD